VGAGILKAQYLFSEHHLGYISIPKLRSFWVKFGKKEIKDLHYSVFESNEPKIHRCATLYLHLDRDNDVHRYNPISIISSKL
jgi:hypothetical protein